VGAVAFGFLLKVEGLDWPSALFVAGIAVTCISFASFAITLQHTAEARTTFDHPAPDAVPAI
jgi:hypothetical protein